MPKAKWFVMPPSKLSCHYVRGCRTWWSLTEEIIDENIFWYEIDAAILIYNDS